MALRLPQRTQPRPERNWTTVSGSLKTSAAGSAPAADSCSWRSQTCQAPSSTSPCSTPSPRAMTRPARSCWSSPAAGAGRGQTPSWSSTRTWSLARSRTAAAEEGRTVSGRRRVGTSCTAFKLLLPALWRACQHLAQFSSFFSLNHVIH